MSTSAFNERSMSNPLCDSSLGSVVTSDYVTPLTVLEVESEEEYLDKWVDEFCRWWSRSEVYPGRWFLHDTSDGVVWWDEPGKGWRVASEFARRCTTTGAGVVFC